MFFGGGAGPGVWAGIVRERECVCMAPWSIPNSMLLCCDKASQPPTACAVACHVSFVVSSHPNRWEAGQRLYMKLLLQLYEAAAAGAPSVPLAERCAAAGGLPKDFVDAFKAVLLDESLDGAFKVMEHPCLENRRLCR